MYINLFIYMIECIYELDLDKNTFFRNSYTSIFTNCLRTDNETKSVKTIYN